LPASHRKKAAKNIVLTKKHTKPIIADLCQKKELKNIKKPHQKHFSNHTIKNKTVIIPN
jgi:hypothetical protein